MTTPNAPLLAGDRVLLRGLVNNTNLNNQSGTVVQVENEKAVVHMDSGRLIKTKRHCLDHLRAQVIAPMDWGRASATTFFKTWSSLIARHDPFYNHIRSNSRGHWWSSGNVYNYLIAKVFRVVNTVRRPGQAGWAFRMATPSDCIRCAVWANGSHDQSSPLGEPRGDEQWWPCIILPGGGTLVPFYCPALAWQNARPWEVNATRVRRVAITEDSEEAITDSLPVDNSLDEDSLDLESTVDNSLDDSLEDSEEGEDSSVDNSSDDSSEGYLREMD